MKRLIIIFALVLLLSFSMADCSVTNTMKQELDVAKDTVSDGTYYCFEADVLFKSTFDELSDVLGEVGQGAVAAVDHYYVTGKPAATAISTGISNITSSFQNNVRKVSALVKTKNFFVSKLNQGQLDTMLTALDDVSNLTDVAKHTAGVSKLSELGLVVNEAGDIIINDPALKLGGARIANVADVEPAKKLALAFKKSTGITALKTSAEVFAKTSSLNIDMAKYSALVSSKSLTTPEAAVVGKQMISKLDELAASGKAFNKGVSVVKSTVGADKFRYVLTYGDEVTELIFVKSGVLVDSTGNAIRSGNELVKVSQKMASFSQASNPGLWAKFKVSTFGKKVAGFMRGASIVGVARGVMKTAAVTALTAQKQYLAPTIGLSSEGKELKYLIAPNFDFSIERIDSSREAFEAEIDDSWAGGAGNFLWEAAGFFDITEIGWGVAEIADSFEDDGKYLKGAKLFVLSNADSEQLTATLSDNKVLVASDGSEKFTGEMTLPDGDYVAKLYVKFDKSVAETVVDHDAPYLTDMYLRETNSPSALLAYLINNGFPSNTLAFSPGKDPSSTAVVGETLSEGYIILNVTNADVIKSKSGSLSAYVESLSLCSDSSCSKKLANGSPSSTGKRIYTSGNYVIINGVTVSDKRVIPLYLVWSKGTGSAIGGFNVEINDSEVKLGEWKIGDKIE